MIINRIAIDKTVTERVKTLKKLDFVHVEKISEYEIMPDIVPLDNQLYFFDDGIEAIVTKIPTVTKTLAVDESSEKYKCIIVNEGTKKIIEYSFEGKNYEQIRD